ncbi:hypothetical protein ACFU7Y_08670 [Kitasatospora sp. NPDC057542]|uniref:hypothetical protein n=1 Tax=Kitasatospora sp. NPDC057542 TaxID=3346162 RepID=UPI00368A6C42
MPSDPYRHLYEDSEIFALDLVRRAADPAVTTNTEHAVRDLARRRPTLAEYDAAIALTAALARLSCTALRAASLRHHPLTARLLENQPAPSIAHAHEITDVLDRLDTDLLSTDATRLGHCFIELTRLALAEQMPGGRPLRESAAEPLGYALACAPEPADALLPLVARAAQLTLACLHHLLDLDLSIEPDSDADTARTTGPDGGALEHILDGFELYKITQQGAGGDAL